jgi:carbamoyl-phosphate synthase large subunit
VNKVLEGRPHCVDAILSGEVQMIVNTTEGAQAVADSFSIRNSALTSSVPHYTTMAGAAAAVGAIWVQNSNDPDGNKGLEVAPLQSYAKGSS